MEAYYSIIRSQFTHISKFITLVASYTPCCDPLLIFMTVTIGETYLSTLVGTELLA